MKTRLPPGPKGKPVIGHLNAFRKDPLGFLLELAREHGDIVRFRLANREITLFAHPDHVRDLLLTNARNVTKSRGLERAKPIIGEGLLTSESDFHLRQRRMCQPAFRRDRVAAYGEVMVDYAQQHRAQWREGPIDMADAMNRLTMAIVGKTLFGADVESEAKEIGESLEEVMQWQSRMFLPFYDLLGKLPLASNRRFKRALAYLDKTIYGLIQERQKSDANQSDLLSILMAARDEEGDGTGMSQVQLRDELMTIFLAGHQTVAHALTWTWYLLSQAPDEEAKLSAEIERVLGNRLPTPADLPALPYTRMVFAESMRLYPPAWLIGRLTKAEYKVGEYVLPPGSTIFASPFVIQRDPRFFPDPERFDPERWTPENTARRPKFSYFPFGGGTRLCLGESFAWTEGMLLIATLLQEWRFKLAPGHQLERQVLLTLSPKGGLPMILERR